MPKKIVGILRERAVKRCICESTLLQSQILYNWMKATDNRRGDSSGRSSSQSPGNRSHSRQHRLQITKITQGMPQGFCLAYCIVSKESSMGLLVHERLLVLDTCKKQLSYYSDIPPLPLRSPTGLGKAKETVCYGTAKKFEFAIQRIRIGHVVVRWIEKNVNNSWKLIMGSNKVAQEFSQLISDSKNAEKKADSPRKSNLNATPKELAQIPAITQRMESKVRLHHDTHEHLQSSRISQKPPLYPSQKTLLDINDTKVILKQPVVVGQEIKSAQKHAQDYFSRHYANIEIDTSEDQKQSHYRKPVSPLSPSYHSYNPLRIPSFSKDKIDTTSSLVEAWLTTSDKSARAAIYERFIRKCQQKVVKLMQNFFLNHLKHEEQSQNGLCILYDDEIKFIYCPLLQSLEEQIEASVLIEKVRLQQQCEKEWELFNFIGRQQQVGQVKIMVPMSCLISYKSATFYCKNILDYVNNKRRLVDRQEYSKQLGQLENRLHVKLRNGQERLYIIQLPKQPQILYLQQVAPLPTISSLQRLPLHYSYIEKYISEGIVSSNKDLQAIENHLKATVVPEMLQLLERKQLLTVIEQDNFTREIGLSRHFLGLLYDRCQYKYRRMGQMLMSAILSYIVQWEVRAKMQIQIFRKKQFGFSIHHFKQSLNALFSGQKSHLSYLSLLLSQYMSKFYSFSEFSLDTYVIPEQLLKAVVYRLGFNVRLGEQRTDEIWSNIDEKMKIQVFPRIRTYRWDVFSNQKESHLVKQLYGQINYQVKTQTPLSYVLDLLKISPSREFHSVSSLYRVLNPPLRTSLNYYLSHFLRPSLNEDHNSLQWEIYCNDDPPLHYNTLALQFYTTLNRVRWLIKQKHIREAQNEIQSMVNTAMTWAEKEMAISALGFWGQYLQQNGHVKLAIEYTLKAYATAKQHYKASPSIPCAQLLAQQSFQLANAYYAQPQYSLSLEHLIQTSQMLKSLATRGPHLRINPQYILLYYKKCQIHLSFGQYQECLNSCLQGIQFARNIKQKDRKDLVQQREFKLYQVLFRCYEGQKMRKELIQVAQICSHKYYQDKVMAGVAQMNLEIVGEIVKMIWIGIIKQVEVISPVSEPIDESYEQIRFVNLKKIRKELVLLNNRLKNERRYHRRQVVEYIRQRMLKNKQLKVQNRLKYELIQCLVHVSANQLQLWSGKVIQQSAFKSEWLMLEGLTYLAGMDFLLGTIDGSLHVYEFQY